MERRKFLAYSLASGLIIWTGSVVPDRFVHLFGISEAQAQTAQLFPQSVASGDPETLGVTLWTRVEATTETITASFQVATDREFRNIVLSGVADSNRSRDYTIKVVLQNRSELRSDTIYFYRFLFQNTSSQVGRFRTLPANNAQVSSLRLGVVSCQDFTNGFYTAFRFLADENIDFVVHLGDAIYETVNDPAFQNNFRSITLPSGLPSAQSLEDYRALYKIYRNDPDLQRVHELFSFITIWDDHEFANDAYQTFNSDTDLAVQNNTPNRRQAATQAWAEYTPTSIQFDPQRTPLESILIYRTFVFGDLMELIMTDERLYRDAPPCGPTSAQRNLSPGCANLANPDRSMLGATQRQWFLDRVINSTRTWKVWGSEVMTMQLRISRAVVDTVQPGLIPVDLFATLDQWDGYPAERAQLFTAIRNAGVQNFVTITGDLHTYVAGYQRPNFNAPLAPGTVPTDAVGIEFVTGSITSSNFAEQPNPFGIDVNAATAIFLASNPHIQFFNSAIHGYFTIEVTPNLLTCRMRAVSSITSQNATMSTLRVFTVPRGQVLLQNVTPAT